MREVPPDPEFKSAERLAFEIYLRTGRRLDRGPVRERKFNPYHDPRNGQFTFAPGGPRSVSGAVFADKQGLWKRKRKPTDQFKPRPPRGSSKDRRAGPESLTGPISNDQATSRSGDEARAEDSKIHLAVPEAPASPLVRVSATEDGSEHANCPDGGNCRATVTITPRNSNEVEIALNEYRMSILEVGWRDNDFQNLVDMRRSLLAFQSKKAIESRISDWDPTKLLPAAWIADNVIDLSLSDSDDPIGFVAYYLTLGVDGPGPRPELLTLENLMDPHAAALTQADWWKKEAIYRSYQELVGGEPIFASTSAVNVSRARPQARGYYYEAEVRAQYGGNRDLRPPRFQSIMDGKEISGQADHLAIIDGNQTAIEAKYTEEWMKSLRNPSSRNGTRTWSVKSQQEMVAQARRYVSSYEGGAIYHTNNVEFARFYTKIFEETGIQNFRFVITPIR